jgi:hypothetical protein
MGSVREILELILVAVLASLAADVVLRLEQRYLSLADGRGLR